MRLIDSENKLFSIILPVYNRKRSVIEALDSIKMQTYRPIEIILIDDGSDDNTKKVILKWREHNVVNNDNSFSLNYYYQENSGAGAARNTGLQKISGSYVQFLDSDDTLHPERLQRLVQTFKETGCDFIQTGFEGFDPDTGDVIQTLYGKPHQNQLELALEGRLWANTLRSAFSTSLVQRISPWNTKMTCFEDREYVERAIAHADKPVAIKDVLAKARRGGGSRISDKLRSYEGRTWRIYCEQSLADLTRHRNDISYISKQAFVSRIYALGFRSNASGWTDLGQKCGAIAASMNVKLNALGYRRYLVWRLGKLGGQLYKYASQFKYLLMEVSV